MILEPIVNGKVEHNITQISAQNTTERILKNKPRRTKFKTKNENKNKEFKFNLYIGILMIFLLGVVVGSIIFRMMIADISVKEIIIEKFSAVEFENKNETELFKTSITRNFKLLAIFWVVGISVVGAPLLILLCFYKGFTTAFVISSFLLKFGFINGNKYIFQKLFLYYFFLVFAIILLTTSSVKVMINVLKNKKDIRLELVRHTIFTILGFLLLIISTLFEIKFL